MSYTGDGGPVRYLSTKGSSMQTCPSTAAQSVQKNAASLWRKRRLLRSSVYAAAVLSACSVFEGNDGFGQSWSGKPLAQLKHA